MGSTCPLPTSWIVQQENDLPGEVYKDEGGETWETLQERESRLKKATLEELRQELEALGVKVGVDKGRKKCMSEKKLRRQYRKLLMRELRINDLEKSGKALQVKKKTVMEKEKEERTDMVVEAEVEGSGQDGPQETKAEMDGEREEKLDVDERDEEEEKGTSELIEEGKEKEQNEKRE
ncbi:hypothetical protein AALO_G00025300 [Alosa alosa]|uniref:Uncharacterized protein n=1 Tax=Alosa alosa TaxID=278164 RepID=A0AAV6HEC1_9TELE|nr:myb-like protein X [Alosa alosa]KAG5284311.1 hypothetical protein AALO_G00025300 [Alosa alosa]